MCSLHHIIIGKQFECYRGENLKDLYDKREANLRGEICPDAGLSRRSTFSQRFLQSFGIRKVPKHFGLEPGLLLAPGN